MVKYSDISGYFVLFHYFISVFMGPLWQTFVSSLGAYTRSSIEGIEDPYDGRYDSDGAEQSLESFIIQVKETEFCCNLTITRQSLFIF